MAPPARLDFPMLAPLAVSAPSPASPDAALALATAPEPAQRARTPRSRKLATTAASAAAVVDQLAARAASSSSVVPIASNASDEHACAVLAALSSPMSSSQSSPTPGSTRVSKKRGQHGQRSANRTIVLTLSASTLPSSPMLLSQSQSAHTSSSTACPSKSLPPISPLSLFASGSDAHHAHAHGPGHGNAPAVSLVTASGSVAPRRRSRRRANSNKSSSSSSGSPRSSSSSSSSKRRQSWDFRLPSPITPLPPPPPPPVNPELKYLLSAFVFPSPMPPLKDPLRIPNMVNVLKRRWVYHDPAPLDANSFSVMSWNILAPTFERSRPVSTLALSPPLSPTLSSSDTQAGWPSDYVSRRAGIATEILYYEPDIICLQECDPDDYADFFNPILGAAGYKGVYATKSDCDGCAIFYRSDRFTLAGDYPSPTTLRYASVPLDGAALDTPNVWRSPRPADHVTRHKMFGNLAQIVVLKNKRTGARVRVVNTHLLWQPEFYDAKLLQTAILLEHLVLADYAGRGMAGALGGETQMFAADVSTIQEEEAEELAGSGKAVSAPIPIPAVAGGKRGKATTTRATTPGGSAHKDQTMASYLPSPDSPTSRDSNPFVTITSRNRSHSPTAYPPSPPASSPPMHSAPPSSASPSSLPNASPPQPNLYIAPSARNRPAATSRSTGATPLPPAGPNAQPLPTIICGDFNSLPNSSVLHLLLTGMIPRTEFGDSHFGRFTAGDRFQHSLALRSAYAHSTLPYTHRVPHFSGMIDHMLYSAGAIKLMGILDSADPPGYLEGVRSMPARHLPSDHLPLLAVFKSAAGYK
ncbi:hypothetical protein BCR44DRAFT_61144 [Catenaria anguillulae PL171]|uniref:Endonuclease/exonuclease/phosphatase domain-containing protein n=1 Tax=Catenaria anguillulae PL171 TaxID=765915 RepID=A0A1Y2HH31_9FUNG|nr:hypothetical protein BCR44DRAFT_61144 [Catenaria anguillulae PL171]